MTIRETSDGPRATLALTSAVALVGGLLGVLCWPGGPELRALEVLLGAVLGTAVGYGLLTRPRDPAPASPTASAPPAPSTQSPAPQWWTDAAANGAAPSPTPPSPAGNVEPAPPLSQHTEAEPLIAQCPRCGGFELDVIRRDEEYALRCAEPGCAHAWRWSPRRPWPPMLVRRTLAAGAPRTDRAERSTDHTRRREGHV